MKTIKEMADAIGVQEWEMHCGIMGAEADEERRRRIADKTGDSK